VIVFDIPGFQKHLLGWYDEHQRALPWRGTRSPYRIWISEIMLQQTRVAVVLQRYRDFLKCFPNIHSLAAARTKDVLAEWSGLGYYRRARSAHKTAKLLVSDCNGRFPRTREALRTLPGIGEYTSAAIASIAFGLPHAVVDGNVRRVLGRLAGKPLSPKSYAEEAQKLLDPARAGDFNQAIMELGATVCTPQPRCEHCPVISECASRGKLQRTAIKPLSKKQKVHFALVTKKRSVLLVQRSRSVSLMPDMWELPADSRSGANAVSFRHSITNTNYLVSVTMRKQPPTLKQGKWIPQGRLDKIPLTGLTRKILRHAGLL
jgi:A/G-specific adenine glycosylase